MVSVNIENINITSISEIRSLGVTLDSMMSMEKQVNSATRSAYQYTIPVCHMKSVQFADTLVKM